MVAAKTSPELIIRIWYDRSPRPIIEVIVPTPNQHGLFAEIPIVSIKKNKVVYQHPDASAQKDKT